MAILRRIGALADVFLKDQLNRRQAEFQSGLVQQRQKEAAQQSTMVSNADAMAKDAIASRRAPTEEQLAAIDAQDPNVGQMIRQRIQAGIAPESQVQGEAMGEVDKGINAATTPDALGTLRGRFDEYRNAMHAKNAPIRDLSDVKSMADNFNQKADVIGNAQATAQEQKAADFKREHPSRPGTETRDFLGRTTGYTVMGEDGKPRPFDPTKDSTDSIDWHQANPNGALLPNQIPALDQGRLEQQYRNTILRMQNSRTNAYGIQTSKVNQALDLKKVFDSNLDPRTGEYNVPHVLTKEVALGMARLLSPNGQIGVELMNHFVAPSLAGDLGAAVSYITGSPVTGNTQELLKMMKDTIDRQGELAEELRQNEIENTKGLAPTELEESRFNQLNKAFDQLSRYGHTDTTIKAPGGVTIRKIR